MKNRSDVEKLLYEFALLLQQETDLRHLYFSSLPLLMYVFDLEKIVLFKYSKRKQCFDPKIGLIKEKTDFIEKIWKNNPSLGELSQYLLNMSIDSLYETEFNRTIREMNLPCNDISRSIINPFIEKKIKNININDLKNRHVINILKNIGITETTYIPLTARNSTVGFMLLSPSDKNFNNPIFVSFISLLSLAIDNLINSKEVSRLEEFIEINKEDIMQKQRLYEIGKTASTIAHEIKNTLVGTIGLFDKLSKHTDNSDKSKKYADIIDTELNKLYRFALDINNYSKSSSFTKKELLDLPELIDKVIEMTATINPKFVFSVCIDKNASKIYADKEQIEQVFVNLFKNSMEAFKGDKEGTIRVIAKKEDDYIVIKIRDNSGGVSESKLSEITKPFFTTKSYGTGLGLSIVSQIIKEHNGTIDFKNIPNGLECTIKLPIPKINNGGSI